VLASNIPLTSPSRGLPWLGQVLADRLSAAAGRILQRCSIQNSPPGSSTRSALSARRSPRGSRRSGSSALGNRRPRGATTTGISAEPTCRTSHSRRSARASPATASATSGSPSIGARSSTLSATGTDSSVRPASSEYAAARGNQPGHSRYGAKQAPNPPLLESRVTRTSPPSQPSRQVAARPQYKGAKPLPETPPRAGRQTTCAGA